MGKGWDGLGGLARLRTLFKISRELVSVGTNLSQSRMLRLPYVFILYVLLCWSQSPAVEHGDREL